MKQKRLTNYLKFGILLFGISFLLTNCEKQLIEDIEYQKESRFNVRTLNQEQVQSNSLISTKLKELNPKEKGKQLTNSQAREIYNSEYGFTINTDFVKYIEDTENGNHSYSFPISRDNPTDDKLENLLLHSNLENGYNAYIIQYGFTANEYNSLDENSINNYNTLLFPIDFDTSVFNNGELAKMVYECSETWTYVTYTGHENGELHGVNQDGTCAIGCNYGTSEWVLTGISCGYYDDGSGGGGDTSTGTDSTGGGGGGTSSDPTDPNYDPTDPNIHGNGGNPVISAPAIDEPDSDCTKLKNLISKPVTNQPPRKEVGTLLNQLQDSTSTTTKEMGFFLNPTDATESQFIPSYFEGEENADEVTMDLGTNAVSVLMHLHYNNETENKKQLSVFSLQDIYEMYQFIDTGHIFSPNTFTNFLTTEHGTNYAIQINDSNAFVNSSFAIKYFIGWEFGNIRDKAEDRYGKDLYNILPNKTNGQNELAFTKFLANENLGLTLFRANNDFTEFTKIEYKNGTFKETPCN